MMEEAAMEQMKKTLPWSVERALLPHSPRNQISLSRKLTQSISSMLIMASPFIICDLYYGFLKCVWLPFGCNHPAHTLPKRCFCPPNVAFAHQTVAAATPASALEPPASQVSRLSQAMRCCSAAFHPIFNRISTELSTISSPVFRGAAFVVYC
jgi:hypothetical protein